MLKNTGEIMTIIICIVLIACTIGSLFANRHDINGANLPFGWQIAEQAPYNQGLAICDRQIASHGFPFTETRSGANCGEDRNQTSFVLNNTIYGVSYMIIIATIGLGIKGIRHGRI